MTMLVKSVVTMDQSGVCKYKGGFNGVLTDNTQSRVVQMNNMVDNLAKLPNWRAVIAAGGNATTFLESVKYRVISYIPVTFDTSTLDNWSQSGSWIDTFSVPNPQAVDYSSVDIKARTKFLQKANSLEQAFSGSTFAAELRETLHGIRHPASALLNLMHTYKKSASKRITRSKFKRADDFKKAAAGSWLEAVFGWLPLFHDIQDGMSALSHMYRPQKSMVKVKSTSKDVSHSGPVGGNSNPGNVIWNDDLFTEEEVFVTYRGAARNTLNVAAHNSFRYWGFTPSDVLPAVWEIIPYSFVVDYFTNISDIIDSASHGTSNLAWACSSVRVTQRLKSAFRFVGFHPSYGIPVKGIVTPSKYEVLGTYVRRTSLDLSDLVIPFHWELPEFKSRKWLNILALVAQKV